MTEQTPAPEKVKLSRSQVMQNHLWGMGTLLYMALTVWWYGSLCFYYWRKYKHLPGKPVTIMLFGTDPEQGLNLMKEYNLRYAFGSIRWAIIGNQLGLLIHFMVSKASFDYTDNILFQHSGAVFEVISNEGCKRGQTIRRPYPQRQPSIRPSHQAGPKARLGKRYR